MDTHPLRNVDNKLYVCVVVVVGSARNLESFSMRTSCSGLIFTHLNILIRHTNVIRVRLQIFRSGHDRKLDCPLIAKCLVCPFPHGADLLDCRNTVVGNEDLVIVKISLLPLRHQRPIRGKFPVGALLLLADLLTFVMTVCPPWAATKSLTFPGGAASR